MTLKYRVINYRYISIELGTNICAVKTSREILILVNTTVES